jgi:hypothetical protein
MPRQFKLMIIVNILFGLLFVGFNFLFAFIGNVSHTTGWTPLWLTIYDYHTYSINGVVIPNFSFYFFWALLLANVYFMFRLQRGKETKQTPS